jgi:hypothetical protein
MDVSTGIYVSKYISGMTNMVCIKNDATGLMNISTNELILRDYIKQPLGATFTQTDSRIIYDTDYTSYYNKYIGKTTKPDEIIPPSKTPPLMKEEYPPLPDNESEISDNEDDDMSIPEEETAPEEEPTPEEEPAPTSENQSVKEENTESADKPAVPVLLVELVNPPAEISAKCCIIV